MWHVVEMHNQRVRDRGLREALVSHLATVPHHVLVSEGQPDGAATLTNVEAASLLVQKLEECSVAYVGSRHASPVAPYCGFSVAPDLGLARLEYLIDYAALPRHKDKWLTNALASILWVCLRENSAIQQIVLPALLEEESYDGFCIENMGNRSYAKRT